jgi:protein-ribulosamine 3-kinase
MERLRAEKILQSITGKDHLVMDIKNIHGGDTSDTWQIQTDEDELFLKKHSLDDSDICASEWQGLKELSKSDDIRIPKCFGTMELDSNCYLLLEHLHLHTHTPSSMALLGTQVAKMHKITAEKHGFHHNNYIGSNPQINNWSDTWIDFYTHCRLMPQAYMSGDAFIEIKAEHLAAKIPSFFEDYKPVPSLLHGDLWSGNTAAIDEETPVIFDPSVYYGDRETDIAMTEMFGGFPPEFYKAYNTEWPLHSGYTKRKLLYNLYHSLNHYNMFGGSYLEQSKKIFNTLLEK